MLEWHQITGFLTLGLWLATNLEGEKAKDSLNSSAQFGAKALLLTHPEYAKNDPIYYTSLLSTGKHSYSAEYLLMKDPSANLPIYMALKSSEEYFALKSEDRHRELAYLTTGMYAITAGLAFLAPAKISEPSEGINFYSPIFQHKALIPVHLLAMAMMPTLGRRIEHDGYSAANNMQTAGWVGFGALSLSLLVITF